MFFWVRLWQNIYVAQPTVQERIQATSEGDAVVRLMKKYHLHAVDRAWIARSANEQPSVRLVQVSVRGNRRSWRQELPFMTAHIPTV